MGYKEKAKELVDKFIEFTKATNYKNIDVHLVTLDKAKQCALIAVENEYKSNRELLFNLRAARVIESEKVYLIRLQALIVEEHQVNQEIEKL